MELHELIDEVCDADTFLVFARALEADRRKAAANETAAPLDIAHLAPGGWQNGSIEAFLEAAVAWAEASNFGTRQGLSPANPWKQFAVFLYCGKIYE